MTTRSGKRQSAVRCSQVIPFYSGPPRQTSTGTPAFSFASSAAADAAARHSFGSKKPRSGECIQALARSQSRRRVASKDRVGASAQVSDVDGDSSHSPRDDRPILCTKRGHPARHGRSATMGQPTARPRLRENLAQPSTILMWMTSATACSTLISNHSPFIRLWPSSW
jgi:hypothetical protein